MIQFKLQRPQGSNNFDPLHTVIYSQLAKLDTDIKPRFPKAVDRLRIFIDEEIDNILKYDPNAKTIEVALNVEKDGSTHLTIVYDGLPYDSVSGRNPVAVISGAIRRLSATYQIAQTSTSTLAQSGTITRKTITFKMEE